MQPSLEVFGSQINIVGEFNPPIFSPEWLRDNELLGPADTESAKNSETLAITPDIARFETEWFHLQVVRKQFVLDSKGPLTPALKDLAIGILTLVSHTPVSALGLNFIADYKVSTNDLFHKVGDVLAPKAIWHKFYPPSDNQSVGLTSLVMEIDPFARGKDPEEDTKVKKFTIRPSKVVNNGVFFALNDHYPIVVKPKSVSTQAEIAIGIIQDYWDSSMKEAEDVFAGILTQAMRA